MNCAAAWPPLPRPYDRGARRCRRDEQAARLDRTDTAVRAVCRADRRFFALAAVSAAAVRPCPDQVELRPSGPVAGAMPATHCRGTCQLAAEHACPDAMRA